MQATKRIISNVTKPSAKRPILSDTTRVRRLTILRDRWERERQQASECYFGAWYFIVAVVNDKQATDATKRAAIDLYDVYAKRAAASEGRCNVLNSTLATVAERAGTKWTAKQAHIAAGWNAGRLADVLSDQAEIRRDTGARHSACYAK